MIRPRILESDVAEHVEHNVVFSEIQDTLIQGIRDAKYLIWAAVAWFSNEVVFNELVSKKMQGLDIRVIISDEDANKNCCKD